MFGVVSQNFIAARHPVRKRVSGCIRTCPIHDFRSKTHVWGGFTQFCCCTSPIPKMGLMIGQSTTLGPKLMVAYEHAQSTTLCPKLMFGVVSRNFVAARHPFQKRVSGYIQSMSFCQRNHFFVFRNEHAQSTTLGPKLLFRVVSRNFVAARHPFRKRVSGCKQSTSFCHWNHFFVYRNEHARSTTLGRKLMFGVVSRNFVAARHPFRKRLSCCIQSMSFCHQNHFFRLSQRTCPIHYFRCKTHVWGGFTQFRCRTSPIPKMGIRCIKTWVFANGTISSFFATNETISLFFATNIPNPLR
jgi:hypothetical protein